MSYKIQQSNKGTWASCIVCEKPVEQDVEVVKFSKTGFDEKIYPVCTAHMNCLLKVVDPLTNLLKEHDNTNKN